MPISLSIKILQIKQEQPEAGEENKHGAEREDAGAGHLRKNMTMTRTLQVSDSVSAGSPPECSVILLWLNKMDRIILKSGKGGGKNIIPTFQLGEFIHRDYKVESLARF